MRILIYWDSISEWCWDIKKWWWVQRLKIDFWKKYKYENMIFNFAISAYTSTHINNNFTAFFKSICKRQENKYKEALCIFMIWINDCAKDISSGEYQVKPEVFRNNLEKISQKISREKLVKDVLFISNINIWEKKANKIAEEFYNYNHDIEIYNGIIEDFCQRKWYHFLDIYGKMSKKDMRIDGTHPDTKWHKKIYKAVKKYLEKKILTQK